MPDSTHAPRAALACHIPTRIAAALGLGVAATGLRRLTGRRPTPPAPASSSARSTAAAATPAPPYTNDFIELYNPTARRHLGRRHVGPVPLRRRHRRRRGHRASGSVPAGGHYLVQEAAGTGGTGACRPGRHRHDRDVRAPAARCCSARHHGADPATGDVAGNAGLARLVGAGTTRDVLRDREHRRRPDQHRPSAARNAAGADTDNNAADFTDGERPARRTPAAPVAAPPGRLRSTRRSPRSRAPAPPRPLAGTDRHHPASSPRRTPPVASTASTSRPPAPAARPTPPRRLRRDLRLRRQLRRVDRPPSATTSRSPARSASSAASPRSPRRRRDVTPAEPTGRRAGHRAGHGAARPPRPTARRTRASCSTPTGTFTVTNTYATNQYAEIGLATGTKPLIAPTEVADAQDTAGHRRRHGRQRRPRASPSTTAPASTSCQRRQPGASRCRGSPPTNPVRVGAAGDLHAPVILDYRNSTWKFQPTSQVTDDGHATWPPSSDTRTRRAPRTSAATCSLGDVQRAELLHHHRRGLRRPAGQHLHATTTTAPATRSPSTTATRTARAARPRPTTCTRQQAKIVAAINALGRRHRLPGGDRELGRSSAKRPRRRAVARWSTR